MFFCTQKTAYEWRISYLSSDVCSSDLNANISAAAEIVAADEAGLGVVAKVLALFRLGQVDDRSGEHQPVHQLVRRVDVDLFIGVGIDVEARGEPADDFAAAVVRGADEELVGLIEDRGVDLRLRPDRKSKRLNYRH